MQEAWRTCASDGSARQRSSSFSLALPRMGVRMKPGSITVTCEVEVALACERVGKIMQARCMKSAPTLAD